MAHKHDSGRRRFLKASAAGATGAVAVGVAPRMARGATSEWHDGMQIHPSIDNLRVVSCHDPEMAASTPSTWDFASQNDAIDTERVQANMDEMAKSLAQSDDADSAWGMILRKPPSKAWNQVSAAIKVNCIHPPNMPRIAIVDKVCRELMRIGVPAGNIVVYDGRHNASRSGAYAEYPGNGLPEGVVVSNKSGSLGGTTMTSVPQPRKGSFSCTADIANGAVDILVNCAVNKGHGSSRGSCTLHMKNHFGTFDPGPGHSGDQFAYLIAINKSNAIVGGDPPRQQLCIMDSIWAMTHGPTGAPPNKAPHRILMGTFGPAVDYLTAKKVREAEMGASHSSYLGQFLTSFGYTESQSTSLELIDVPPAGSTGTLRDSRHGGVLPEYSLALAVAHPRMRRVDATFALDHALGQARVDIFAVDGRIIRSLTVDTCNRKQTVLHWNGTDGEGRLVGAGNYVVRLSAGNEALSRELRLIA